MLASRNREGARAGARYHGDQAALPGMLDFAVNVRPGGPPAWLTDRLTSRLPDLGSYPSQADQRRAVDAVADPPWPRAPTRWPCWPAGAEGFALLAGSAAGARPP